MLFRPFFCLLVSALCLPLHGGEVTLETKPFDVIRSFDAKVMPSGETTYLELVPEAWTDFEIVTLVPHGAKVAEGDVLAAFETEDVDRWIEDKRAGIAAKEIALSTAKRNLDVLQKTAAPRLEAWKRAAAIAKEENEYFKTARRKTSEQRADQALLRAEWRLANEKEELDQLQQMYAADDLTEQTEEIILTRQKNSVQDAELALSLEKLDHKRTREVQLPREAVNLAESERDSAVQAAKQEKEIPETIEATKLEVAALQRGLEQERKQLAEVERDRALFEFKAPAAGWFYHGEIIDGRWTTGDLVKTLMVHGKPMLKRKVATFVPESSEKHLVARVDEATARSLAEGAVGVTTFPGLEDAPVEASVSAIAVSPDLDGTWRVDLAAKWPEGLSVPVGSQAHVRIVAYHKDATIAVASKALSFGADGWSVEVKLADGKTQRRPVTRGRVNESDTEILEGLEEGQVIIVP
ncbi:MAG: hypothetical protein H7A49_06750 [Akkermansiaceae bacterium]|nr:hypothetical protein [Akkermansiaceae bacterium]